MFRGIDFIICKNNKIMFLNKILGLFLYKGIWFCGILKGLINFGNVCKILKCKFVNIVIIVIV